MALRCDNASLDERDDYLQSSHTYRRSPVERIAAAAAPLAAATTKPGGYDDFMAGAVERAAPGLARDARSLNDSVKAGFAAP